MQNKKAVVLMSTYNGEKYVAQQLDSILRQDYPDVEIYVRDDGSLDATPKILEEYDAKYEKFHLLETKENLGYPACFYALTDLDVPGDVFFFADQDDVWLEQKISRAMAHLAREEEDKPVAYYAGYHICDGALKIVGESGKVTRPIELKDTLFEVCGLEFTMAINRAAKEFLFTHKPQKAKARGTWMSMLYAAFGKIVYDNEPCALYRRHTSAVTSSNMGFFGLWKWRIKKFFGDGFAQYRILLDDFYHTVGDELSPAQKKTVRLFAEKGYLRHVIQKVFYPKRLRRRWVDELALRFVFLIGQL